MADTNMGECNPKGKGEDKEAALHLSADELFNKAAEIHQRGEIVQALNLYARILEQFPNYGRIQVVKTIIAGLKKEKIGIYWDRAAELRAQCKMSDAQKLYKQIILEYPDSPDAMSAKQEIQILTDIEPLWNEALQCQSNGNDEKAAQLFTSLITRYPQSPEAENANLLLALIRQNQFMPAREVSHGIKAKDDTPDDIVAHLLTQKKTRLQEKQARSPEAAADETQSKKIEAIWSKAGELEKDGLINEAALLYANIIESSPNNYRVRDAKYRLGKIDAIRKDDFLLVGTNQDNRITLRQLLSLHKTAVLFILCCVMVIAGTTLYFVFKPATWSDIVENTKKSVVVIRTADGAGTGFIASSDGLVFTSAYHVGKNKEVDVRLYSGQIKRAVVVKESKLLDVAVLKMEGSFENILPMSFVDSCREGDEIRTIGAPLGVEYFINRGIISHCNVERDGVKFIQTDPALLLGSRGGPCLDSKGKIIGMSTSVALNDEIKSLNLVLPLTVVRDFMEGKLTSLENALLKKQEESAMKEEGKKEQVYGDADKTYQKLQGVVDQEYSAYLLILDSRVKKKLITYEFGMFLAEEVKLAPSGAEPISQWIHRLANKVVKGEETEDNAVKLIKEHFNRK